MFILSPPPSPVCRRELLQISFRKPHKSAENKHINFCNNVFKTMCPWNKNLNSDKCIELYNNQEKDLGTRTHFPHRYMASVLLEASKQK